MYFTTGARRRSDPSAARAPRAIREAVREPFRTQACRRSDSSASSSTPARSRRSCLSASTASSRASPSTTLRTSSRGTSVSSAGSSRTSSSSRITTLAPSSSTSASCSRRARSSSWSEREGRGGPRPFNNRPPSLPRANVLSRRELPLLRPGRPRCVAHICLGAYMQPQPRLGGGGCLRGTYQRDKESGRGPWRAGGAPQTPPAAAVVGCVRYRTCTS
mmetsp:Transcript_12639/g.37109  ORF Transcript_12639/g.37109 Transcript_12639/m.37109 type:complete len:218 (+) Transcript_12639:51-704(+)